MRDVHIISSVNCFCIVKGAFKMMERLNIKREKIADIQDVIHEGDINKDGVLDFEEWRTKMKK